ncbi:uncharacterized protein LOC105664173 [Megachile rotundata]|uniref:uncharacterized protein LOC105664173 n=1 Tax=Megachile rotundata TaxID=143995 RepID=UPI000614EC1A|nr:PREDICTED: uncharacterized protein LOC105664173 [Megachile rotundata]
MDRLQFIFTVRGAADMKTNVLCITSIGTPDGHVYAVPEEYQPATLHTEIVKLPAFNKVKNSLTKRHQTRKIWINLTKALANTYLDEGGNLQIGEFYLEEILEKPEDGSQASEQPLMKILEKLLEKSQIQSESRSIGKIAERFMIERFDGRNSNADQWIASFEKECGRFDISDDGKKIEILKSFMDKGAADWYSCTLLKLTIEADWGEWKRVFCETFVSKGWSRIRYALSFKYQTGLLLDYAIKKEKLLLEVRNSIDDGTLIDLIATGLPNFVADRIDREKLRKTEDLYNEIGKLEHLVHKRNFEIRKNKNYINKEKTERTPCETCKNKGKGIRFHPVAECWFKDKEHETKHINSSVLEVEVSDEDPKN